MFYLTVHSAHFIYSYMASDIWKEGKEMFHLTMHSTHFIYGYMVSDIWKEGNVLFNDALDTLYLWLYGIRHMVKDYLDSKRGNALLPHLLLFPIRSNGHLTDIPHTMAFVTPVMEHWLE